MEMQQGPASDERAVDDRDPDYWGTILDVIPPVLRAWKFILISTLAAGAIAYFMSPPKAYSSVSYLGPFDEGRAKYVYSVVRSNPVLKAVLAKTPNYPQQGMQDEDRRRYLEDHIQLYPATGSDPKRPSLYVLEVLGHDPSRLQPLLTALIDALLPATKPPPETAARLDRLLKAAETQTASLSTVIDELLKHSEQMVPTPGYYPPNVADIVKLRADSIARAEDIKRELAGLSTDIVFSPPTVPDKSAPDAAGASPRRTAVKTMGVTFAALVLIIVFLHIVEVGMRSPVYGSRLLHIRDALPWRRKRES